MKIEPKSQWVNIHSGEHVLVLESINDLVIYEKKSNSILKRKFEKPTQVFLNSYKLKCEEEVQTNKKVENFVLNIKSKYS